MNIDILISDLIQREGGYVNNPDDRGGPTKFGITLATLAEFRGKPCTAADVQALDGGEAADIYRRNYFYTPGFYLVADPLLQAFLFDWGVNSGQGTAVEGLQRSLAPLYAGKIDGVLGPLSKAALAKVTNHDALFFRVKADRLDFLLRWTGTPNQQSGVYDQAEFAVGWSNRCRGFDKPLA